MTHTSHRRKIIPTPAPIREESRRETGLPVISRNGKIFVANLDLAAAVKYTLKGPVRRVSKKLKRLEELGVPPERWWRV